MTAAHLLIAAAATLLLGASSADPLTLPPADGLESIWLKPRQPQPVHGRTWLVGSAAVNVVVIDSGAGLVLIDGGPAHMAALIERNLTEAGFSIRDVKFILSSEPHYDHAGALSALVRDSGAIVLSSAAGAKVLRRGRSGADDPQQAALHRFPPVNRVRTIGDGGTVSLGGFVVTAHATPGHTPGSMSWSWRSCEAGNCAALVFAASLSPRTDGRFRFSDPRHGGALAAFRRSFATLRDLPCDIVVTAHPVPTAQSQSAASDGCDALADRFEAELERQLISERTVQQDQGQPLSGRQSRSAGQPPRR